MDTYVLPGQDLIITDEDRLNQRRADAISALVNRYSRVFPTEWSARELAFTLQTRWVEAIQAQPVDEDHAARLKRIADRAWERVFRRFGSHFVFPIDPESWVVEQIRAEAAHRGQEMPPGRLHEIIKHWTPAE